MPYLPKLSRFRLDGTLIERPSVQRRKPAIAQIRLARLLSITPADLQNVRFSADSFPILHSTQRDSSGGSSLHSGRTAGALTNGADSSTIK